MDTENEFEKIYQLNLTEKEEIYIMNVIEELKENPELDLQQKINSFILTNIVDIFMPLSKLYYYFNQFRKIS